VSFTLIRNSVLAVVCLVGWLIVVLVIVVIDCRSAQSETLPFVDQFVLEGIPRLAFHNIGFSRLIS